MKKAWLAFLFLAEAPVFGNGCLPQGEYGPCPDVPKEVLAMNMPMSAGLGAAAGFGAGALLGIQQTLGVMADDRLSACQSGSDAACEDVRKQARQISGQADADPKKSAALNKNGAGAGVSGSASDLAVETAPSLQAAAQLNAVKAPINKDLGKAKRTVSGYSAAGQDGSAEPVSNEELNRRFDKTAPRESGEGRLDAAKSRVRAVGSSQP